MRRERVNMSKHSHLSANENKRKKNENDDTATHRMGYWKVKKNSKYNRELNKKTTSRFRTALCVSASQQPAAFQRPARTRGMLVFVAVFVSC